MERRRSCRKALAVSAGFAILVGAFGGYSPARSQTFESRDTATVPASATVLAACYRNDGEKLVRIVSTEDECGEHESFVQLSPGEPGPQGPQGLPGDSSGSNVLWKTGLPTQQYGSTELVSVASLTVPAGKYLLSGQASVSGGGSAACRLQPEGHPSATAFYSPSLTTQSDVWTWTLSMAQPYEFDQRTMIDLRCVGALINDNNVRNPRRLPWTVTSPSIIAQSVGNVERKF